MSYIDLNWDFSQFDRDNMHRYQAAAYWRSSNEIARLAAAKALNLGNAPATADADPRVRAAVRRAAQLPGRPPRCVDRLRGPAPGVRGDRQRRCPPPTAAGSSSARASAAKATMCRATSSTTASGRARTAAGRRRNCTVRDGGPRRRGPRRYAAAARPAPAQAGRSPDRRPAARHEPSRCASSPARAARTRRAARSGSARRAASCGCSAGSSGTRGGAHAHDQLRARKLGDKRVVGVDGRLALQAQPLLPLPVHEEDADAGIPQHVAAAQVHAVAVVERKGDRVLVQHAHEPAVAALVGARRLPVLVGGGQEEHVHALDEGSVALVDRVGDEPLLDAVGETARVEAILERPAALVVELVHGDMMAR